MYKSYTSVKFIPKYLILFDAIASEIFLMFFSLFIANV